MAEDITGVAPATPAAAPVVTEPAQPAQQPQGFGAGQPTNGFTATTPAVPAPVAQPVAQPAINTESARTAEQFEKLVESNRRLAEGQELLRQQLMDQASQRKQSQQQFAPVNQVPSVPAQAAQPALPKLSDYVEIDANGERFVNEQKFNAAVADIYQKASRAEEVVTNYVKSANERETERMNKEAFAAYPQLDERNRDKFSQRFAQQTRAIALDSMVNPHQYGGRPLSFKEAADFVAEGSKSSVVTPEVPTPTVNKANQVLKEQAAAAPVSTPPQVTQGMDSDREYDRLVKGTRLGSDEAIAVRLKNATHKLEDVEKV